METAGMSRERRFLFVIGLTLSLTFYVGIRSILYAPNTQPHKERETESQVVRAELERWPISYFKDPTTGLCFAERRGAPLALETLGNVPCTPEVERSINGSR
jgi:hypothetical protein